MTRKGIRTGLLLLLPIAAVVLGPQPRAADPATAAITLSSTPVTWRGTALAGGAVGDPLLGFVGPEDLCEEGLTCDTFMLTIGGTPADWIGAGKMVHLHLDWTVPVQDFDLYVHKGDLNGPVVASSGNGATNGILLMEDADLDPNRPAVGTGTFAVHVVYYTATAADQYSATARVVDVPVTPPPPPPPPPGQEPEGTPRFSNYIAPPGLGDMSGEPSIGVNGTTQQTFSGVPNGGTVNYFGGFLPSMLRVTFNDGVWPAKATWETAPLTVATLPRVAGDPILFTDRITGRTFVTQEYGLTPLGSTTEFTDDDGRTFSPSVGSGPPSGIDHETVAGGPYHAPIPSGALPLLYPHGVWYCSQNIADAVCSISFDGGRTFGPAVPIYTAADCGGIHGHIKIGPDGTAYVPNGDCNGQQAVVVSEDNGVTWSVRRIPTSTAGDRDPAVAVGSDNTLYFAYMAGDRSSHVAVSRDRGLTWISDTDIGAPLGLHNNLFHTAVAGDGDRAAVAWFGSTTAGDDYNLPVFAGDWYLFVATTYDRGAHWWTQNVTPGDPIQRGGICEAGACRNLLDFFGSEIDNQGRILVGYEDGCISNACRTGLRSFGLPAGNDFTAKAVIARQTGGRTLFAASDPPAGPVAQPPASPALPPPAASTCGAVVADDTVGDASNNVVAPAGGADPIDITRLSFRASPDGQSVVTSIALKNFSTTPVPGTLGAYYRTVWTGGVRNPDGSITTTTYATEAATDVTGTVAYRYGKYDAAANDFLESVTATGAFTTGPGGTLDVQVPRAYLGNPAIPVTTTSALPAVIEPYAVVFTHEEALYWSAPVDRAPDYGFAGSNWAVCLPSTTECLGDDDPRVAYSGGWHTVTSASASGGHFRFHSGSSPDHSATLSFQVPDGRTGDIAYSYGTSTKGGSASVLIDGHPTTVLYTGATGGTRDPVFGPPAKFANLGPGPHTLEIRNMQGAVYVDGFCVTTASAQGQPDSYPGSTSIRTIGLAPGESSSSVVPIDDDDTALSVFAEETNNLPFRVVVLRPSGSVLTTVDSVAGAASFTVPVSSTGVYVVKVLNVGLSRARIWTAATPTVLR